MNIKEALYYKKTPNGVRCLLCPNNCLIFEGEVGICHARKNMGGVLYSIVYGKPCTVNIDPVEKKPLYHFMPGTKTLSLATFGCNLSCLNCQNWEISQSVPENKILKNVSPELIIEEAVKNNIGSISYTYTEPTIYFEYVFDIAVLAKQKGIKNILVSNGYINPEPLEELAPYIDAVNIDLKTFDNEVYTKLCGARLEPILKTLKTLRDKNIWTEITYLLIPQWTDDMETIELMCDWLVKNNFTQFPIHFSRFHPANKLSSVEITTLEALTEARNIALKAGLKYVYIGNVPQMEYNSTFCDNCNKLLVERNGYSVKNIGIKNQNCVYCGHQIHGIW